MTKKTPSLVRQQQILNAALEIIATQGLANLNMADLALAINVTPSNLYRHYKNKAAILDAVLTHLQKHIDQNLTFADQYADDPLKKIHHALYLHAQMARANPVLLQIMVTGKHYDKAKEIQTILEGYRQRLCLWIKEAQDMDLIHASLSPESLFLLFLGLIMPAAALLNMSIDSVDPVTHFETHWNTLIHGLYIKNTIPPNL